MAKFKDFKYTFRGFEKKGRINVNKLGLFTISINRDDVEEMGFSELQEIEFNTVDELEIQLNIKLKEYYNSTTTTTQLLIQIKYGTSGNFQTNEMFKMRLFTGSEIESSIRFDFRIIIKKERNGQIVYLKDVVDLRQQPDKFKKSISEMDGVWTFCENYCSRTRMHEYGDLLTIPYSDAAYQTLERSKQGLKNIANILEKVFSQDQQILSNQLQGNILFQISGNNSNE